MAESGATLLARVAAIVGHAHVLSAPADVEPYLVDWRGRYRGQALAVVRPGSTAEVSAVVRTCTEAGIAIVAQGGNTGLCGGAIAREAAGEIVLSLTRMQRIRHLDAANATLVVDAGVTLAAAQEAAADAGMLFPLSLASEGSCTVGGNLSTNAGGTAVLRYGNARELTLGIEVVLADGSVWDGLRGLRKDNTGYDLKQLFIGAEGTLGVITAAVLKLFAAPRVCVTSLCAVANPQLAIALLMRMKAALGDRLTGFELMSAHSLELSHRHHGSGAPPLPGHPWYVLIQADDSAAEAPLEAQLQAALAAAAESGDIIDAVVAGSVAQARQLWALRENISEAQRRQGPNIKHDISLPVSSIPAFLAVCDPALLQAFPGAQLVVFGHLGDGNLHYNLSAPDGADVASFMSGAEAANAIVHDLVARHGGSFSAEHGIGQLKRGDLVHYKQAIELRMMHSIKAALDPRGLMNPGKVL